MLRGIKAFLTVELGVMKEQFRFFNLKEYLISALCTTVLFLGILWYKQIYPFGSLYLVNFNDFKAQSVPIYMHLWDALHGQSAFFFDWRIGGGSGFAGTFSHFSLFSPFSLFFLFVRRSDIPASMSWFILLKLVFMSLTMCCFLRHDQLFFKTRPVSSLWIILGSVGYALSGYSMQYYGFPWMDTAVMVPLLFLFLNRLLERPEYTIGKSEAGYVTVLCLILMINIPQAFAVCLIVMGYVCGFLFLVKPEPELRKAAALNIIVLSMIGLGLSMVLFLPGLRQISHSYRMSYGSYGNVLENYLSTLDLAKQEVYRKNRLLCCESVPLLLFFIRTLIGFRKKQRNPLMLFSVFLMILAVSPVLFESVNGIFHNGAYSSYPMRYGFVNVFLIIVIGLFSWNQMCPVNKQKLLEPAVCLFWCGFIVFSLRWVESSESYAYGALYENYGSLRDHNQVLDRVKLADSSMMENYPLYGNLTALSNYVPLNSAEQISYSKGMGYTQMWVALNDAGGTLFSDALSQANTWIETIGAEEALWNKGTSDHPLFEQAMLSNAGINEYRLLEVYDKALYIDLERVDFSNQIFGENPFDNENSISSVLFGKELFTVEEYSTGNGVYEFDIVCHGDETLYYWSTYPIQIYLFVNDTPVPAPELRNRENYLYPVSYNNSVIPLGSYSGETVHLRLEPFQADTIDGTFSIGHLNLDLFETTTKQNEFRDIEYHAGKSSLEMNFISPKDGFAMIPIYADPGWTCMVNGVRQSVQSLFGMYMVVPVTEGENTISLAYWPEGMTAGIMISLISLILFGVLIAVFRAQKDSNNIKTCGIIAERILQAVWIVYLLFVLVIPILFRIGKMLWVRLF